MKRNEIRYPIFCICIQIVQGVEQSRLYSGRDRFAGGTDGPAVYSHDLMIYPTLACVFGDDFDFTSIKEKFGTSTGGKRAIADYTEKMQCLLSLTNSDMKRDIIMLCLCIVSVDGKVSLKEKYYIRQLCDA